jgi:TonB family protein
MSDTEMLMVDDELKSLLFSWRAPDAPASLDEKVLAAFRTQARIESVSGVSVNNCLPGLSQLSTEEVKIMKECKTCQEAFASKFIFCPIDGTLLSDAVTEQTVSRADDGEQLVTMSDQVETNFPFAASDAYHLTIIEDKGLVSRLFTELREAGRQSRLTWPEFKSDPIGFTRRSSRAYGMMAWRFFSSPNVAIASLAAILLMMTAVIGLVWLDRNRAETLAMRDKQREDLEYLGAVDIPEQQEEPEKGTAGTNKGDGGGSKAKQEKPGGGGGGGREDQRPASQGKLPQASLDIPQILAPDPNPPPIKNPSLPVVASIDADPLLFPPDMRPVPYGDPKSKSNELSSGPGSGNGIGTGTGGGVGSGEGGGVGPGRGGNTGGGDRNPGGGGPGGGGGGDTDYNKTFKPGEVTQKARILSKPSPEYTEEARKNQVTGTVTLQMVFSSSGGVTNIRTISGLPYGLTEKAIAAARRISFSPAMKDGRPVSQYIRVEYNFNIY